jgi:hypothetical protein
MDEARNDPRGDKTDSSGDGYRAGDESGRRQGGGAAGEAGHGDTPNR